MFQNVLYRFSTSYKIRKKSTTSLEFRQCAASIYRNVSELVGKDYTKVNAKHLRPGWRQVAALFSHCHHPRFGDFLLNPR
jgi:hypothetical protein